MKTIEYFEEKIRNIKNISNDDEKAHSLEDKLRNEILEEIAAGNPLATDLAKLALITNDIDFDRWYA